MSSRDKLKTGTREQVLDKLAELARRLSELDHAIRRSKPTDERHVVLRSLVRFAADQLRTRQMLYNFSTEFHAWVTRNLFETSLLCRYALSSEANTKRLATGVQHDEREMLEGLQQVVPEEASYFEKGLRAIEELLVKHGRSEEDPPPRLRKLAEAAGAAAEYDGFYKLYSKYVHPTPWLLCGRRDRVHSRKIRNIFLIKAQVYAVEIGRMVSQATGLPDVWTAGLERDQATQQAE